MFKIFDGHNDVLSKLYRHKGDVVEAFTNSPELAINLERAQKGGLIGGFCAIYMHSPDVSVDFVLAEMNKPEFQLPLPKPLEFDVAAAEAQRQAEILIELEEAKALKICRTVGDIETSIAEGTFAAIMHMEGVEAFSESLEELYAYYELGLRSLGPVWSRNNIFAHGVPFAFPSSPDIGPGLTEAGFELIRACNELGVLVDLSHLNEAGFWDVAKTTEAPLVATHSNAHALCANSRNLTDKQLAAIAETNGLVGVNYAVSFLRKDGQKNTDTSMETIIRHLDHMVTKLGEDGVALGSDYDGAVVPNELETSDMLPNLTTAMLKHGFGEELTDKICHKNWLRVLRETWK